MVKYKHYVFAVLMLLFLSFSFYPTYFELSKSHQLVDKNREFILEHNYYWPDFNLYLSKIRQGYEGRFTAVEKYTSEKHQGSLIQEFYVVLGQLGRLLKLDPNLAYQLGRLILSPLLLLLIILIVKQYFKSAIWQIIAFIIIMVSGSFPHFYTDSQGLWHLSRYMEWWSNIDSLQRITFIPHILFGQVVSFYLLYKLAIQKPTTNDRRPTTKIIFYIILANLTGLVFPPSLITFIGVLIIFTLISILKSKRLLITNYYLLITIFSLPSLLYLFFITRQLPWSALVEFHRTHPMMVPLDQYVLGTGPIILLGFFGSLLAIIRRKKKFYPLVLWVVSTFLFASLFSVIKEQSPLRFTQTGLFIPLGILGAYFFYRLFRLGYLSYLGYLLVFFYILENLTIMSNSLIWQTTFIKQRVGANIPPVPYPPQTMYPLTAWMDGIRWLRDNTDHDSVVLAEITAGNFIPAYSGNYVYFGQSNTVDYEKKQQEVNLFFSGEMSKNGALLFLKQGRIKYIFLGPQEKEMLQGKSLEEIYPFLKPIYSNPLVSIYSAN